MIFQTYKTRGLRRRFSRAVKNTMIKHDRQRDERKRERLELRRQWKLGKPRPLNDLLKNGAGLIKWLLLLAGLVYLYLNGGGLLTLFK